MDDPLERAICLVGGVGALAGHAGVVQSAVSNWKARKRVPSEYCARIERATNRQVTCEQLRPDLEEDWAYLRASGHKDVEAAT